MSPVAPYLLGLLLCVTPGCGKDSGEAYCTWAGPDGETIRCEVDAGHTCFPGPGSNYCNSCGCYDPKTNSYSCDLKPCK